MGTTTDTSDDVFTRPSSVIEKSSDLMGRAIAILASTPAEVEFRDGTSKDAMKARTFLLDDEDGRPALTDLGTMTFYWARFVKLGAQTPGRWYIGRVTRPDQATVLEDLDDPEFGDVLAELRALITAGEVS